VTGDGLVGRLVRRLRQLVVAAAVVLAVAATGGPPALGAGCQFRLGFATLASLMPEQVGTCVEEEHFKPSSGNALQHTSAGLLVWRKADNWTAFTNGYQTWINGPLGLVGRLNSERYPWEADADAGPTPPQQTIGRSVQGRPIQALAVGQGPKVVTFVGDTHGQPESVTDNLMLMAASYYRQHRQEIPAGVTAYFIPTMNPDGLADGARLNAHGIDLNRNWGTSDWSTNVTEPTGRLAGGGGLEPFSEPESRAMRDFLLENHAVASIFYHAPWGGIFEEPHSIQFGQALGAASGYPAHAPGDTPYPITGTAHRWADEHGEVSALLELRPDGGLEWPANHAAMDAALQWAAAHAS
jgi:hypothetical protein